MLEKDTESLASAGWRRKMFGGRFLEDCLDGSRL